LVNYRGNILVSQNFDLVFVMQDFKRPPIHINAVPAKSLEEVKEWLDSVDIPYSEGPVNLNWPQIMKTVTEDPYEFYREGGWDFLQSGEGGEDDDSEEESSAESAFDPGSDFDEDESESESDFSEDESESDISDDPSDEGEDWSEQEEKAKKSDKKKAAARGEEMSDSDDDRKKSKSKANGKSKKR